MPKSYTQELEEWVKRRKHAKREKYAVAFLTVRDDVKSALDLGYSVKTIWGNLRDTGRIDFSYETFLSLVNRKIRKTPDVSTQPVATRLAPQAATAFAFNPVANAKELL